jgi:hypothetical protein
VKGVTVSRGPVLKRGPGDHEIKRKNLIIFKKISFGAPNFQASRAPKFSGPKPAYLTYTEVNLHVWRGPVHIGFTGPGRALDAPACILIIREYI